MRIAIGAEVSGQLRVPVEVLEIELVVGIVDHVYYLPENQHVKVVELDFLQIMSVLKRTISTVSDFERTFCVSIRYQFFSVW